MPKKDETGICSIKVIHPLDLQAGQTQTVTASREVGLIYDEAGKGVRVLSVRGNDLVPWSNIIRVRER